MNTAVQEWLDESRFKSQLTVMLEMQDSLNKVVFPDWATRNLGWHRAIYVEAAEYLEHLGTWKWWKKGTPDFPQANMELVDIWHFLLSGHLTASARPEHREQLVLALLAHVRTACASLPPVAEAMQAGDEARHREVDALVGSAGLGLFNIAAFVRLLSFSGMTFDLLYQRYVGKNMLNRFRQEHGYKAGTYAKTWAGEEDNQHLERIMESLPLDADLPAKVYAELERHYQELVLAKR